MLPYLIASDDNLLHWNAEGGRKTLANSALFGDLLGFFLTKVGVRDKPEEMRHGEIRFVDFCAGLGGFHRGLSNVAKTAAKRLGNSLTFSCVAASELEDDLRKSYVLNFPEIAGTYGRLHAEPYRSGAGKLNSVSDPALLCAMPEFDDEGRLVKIHGDMTWFLNDAQTGLRNSSKGKPLLPAHDLLCAGFPCQPFSKSGAQLGFEDTRGTVFHTIATILREHSPAFLFLENVGNFARHDDGNTWSRVRRILEDDLGYDIVATEHVGKGTSPGLLSPHHLGYPHHRERFFIIGQRKKPSRLDSPVVRELLREPLCKRQTFPSVRANGALSTEAIAALDKKAKNGLMAIISYAKSPSENESLVSSQISADRTRCINHWSKLLQKLEELDKQGASPTWRETMPSFPIWGYELDPWHWYPIDINPADHSTHLIRVARKRQDLLLEARRHVRKSTNLSVDIKKYGPAGERVWLSKPFNPKRTKEWIASWPAYAGKRDEWPRWKQRHIEQNRQWALRLWSSVDPQWLRDWLDTLYSVIKVPSFQKLEWNCKGEELEIWSHILQFRPSGLRVKRLAHVPALVAMTTTQIPIVPRMNKAESLAGASPGAQGRHLIPSEALQLQGFPLSWTLPANRERAFTCFGNAVHVGVVHDVVASWLFGFR